MRTTVSLDVATAASFLPRESLAASFRITTHPRASAQPLRPVEAWRFVDGWLSVDVVRTPAAAGRHADVLASLIDRYRIAGNLFPDVHLAALAIEHGLGIRSADTDLARFTEVRWHDPIAS